MARTVTIQQLLARVRQRADVEGAELPFPDDEIVGYINESIAALHSEIVEAGEDDFLSSFEFSTVAGQEAYDLEAEAADFYKLEHVEVRIGSEWQPVTRWQFSERHAYDSANGWNAQGHRAYRLINRDDLHLLPVPDGVYTVRVWYHGASVKLVVGGAEVGGTDIFDGRDGWEEWVVIDAAIKVGVKEETDVSALVLEREKAETRIRPQARTKDRARPARVSDVERRVRSPWGDAH